MESRAYRLGVTAFVFLTFAIIMIPAGHGGAPIVLLMLAGLSSRPWAVPASFAWLGVVGLIASDLSRRRLQRTSLLLIALAALIASWVLFLVGAEDRAFAATWSVPFLGCALFKAAMNFGII